MSSLNISDAISSNQFHKCEGLIQKPNINIRFEFQLRLSGFADLVLCRDNYRLENEEDASEINQFEEDILVIKEDFDLQQGKIKLLNIDFISLYHEEISTFNLFRYFSIINSKGTRFESAEVSCTFSNICSSFLSRRGINRIRNSMCGGGIRPKILYTDTIPFYVTNDDDAFDFAIEPHKIYDPL